MFQNYNNNRNLFSKPYFIILISGIISGAITIPAIIPHITHPDMIYHILLHFAGLILALFLTIISVLAYLRTPKSRILFMTFGFFTLVLVEMMYLFNATEDIFILVIPKVNIEISHLFLLVMVTLFGIGFIKGNK